MSKKQIIIISIVAIFLIIAACIFIIRAANDKKYQKVKSDGPAYMADPQNLELYPQEIEGVSIKYIDRSDLKAFHLIPDEKKHKGVVVCYGGSEGSPGFNNAEFLAKAGYECLAVFFFAMPGQQELLVRIPLERFEAVLNYIESEIADQKPISVIGASKGAEYALNLAGIYPEIANLILISPSAYNFAGLDFSNIGSSWTFQGKELPYINLIKSDFSIYLSKLLLPSLLKSPIAYRYTYESAVANDPAREEKLIEIENIDADILLIAGADDQMWQSAEMAQIIKSRCQGDCRVEIYQDAGHIFAGEGILNAGNLRLNVGGSLEGNRNAAIASEKEILNFLEEKHK